MKFRWIHLAIRAIHRKRWHFIVALASFFSSPVSNEYKRMKENELISIRLIFYEHTDWIQLTTDCMIRLFFFFGFCSVVTIHFFWKWFARDNWPLRIVGREAIDWITERRKLVTLKKACIKCVHVRWKGAKERAREQERKNLEHANNGTFFGDQKQCAYWIEFAN